MTVLSPVIKASHKLIKPRREERDEGAAMWRSLMLRRVNALCERLSLESDEDRRRMMAYEIIQCMRRAFLGEQAPASGPALLAETFEGRLIASDGVFVTVQFFMGKRQEQRRFPRAQLGGAELRVGDVLHLRCELALAPSRPPLSAAEVEQWERRHERLANDQSQPLPARSLEEEEP